MHRPILSEAHIHPAIRERIATLNQDIVKEVQDAVARQGAIQSDAR